ncbi:hypothetical protein D3C78_1523040 [compost metagenome]
MKRSSLTFSLLPPFAAEPALALRVAAASFCAAAFALPFAVRLQGGGLLISEVHTRSAPADLAMASASSRETMPSFSPLSPVRTTSDALICSLINTATSMNPPLITMIKLSYMELA